MKAFYKYIKQTFPYIILGIAGFIAINIYKASNFIINSDEINAKGLSLGEFISDQFKHYTSSIFPKFLEYISAYTPTAITITLNILIYIFCVILLIALYRSIFNRRMITVNTVDTKFTFFAYSLFIFLIGTNQLNDSVFSGTGAEEKFWILPFFLLSFCSIGGFDIARDLKIGKWKVSSFVAIFSAIIVGISSLQFTIVLLIFHISIAIFFLQSHFSKWAIRHLILVFLTTVAFLAQILSPGNLLNYAKNVNDYMPDINEVSFGIKLESNFRWLADALINQSGFIFILLALINFIMLLDANKNLSEIAVFNKIDEMMKGENRRHAENKKDESEIINSSLKELNMTKTTVVRIENIEEQVENKQLRNKIFAIINLIILALLIAQKITNFVDFHVIWKYQGSAGSNILIILAMLIPIFLLFSNSLLFKKEPKQNKKLIILVFGLAYFITLLSSFFSPLMFIDGFTAIFVPNIVLTVLILFNVPTFALVLFKDKI
jgi:hypothetical protein